LGVKKIFEDWVVNPFSRGGKKLGSSQGSRNFVTRRVVDCRFLGKSKISMRKEEMMKGPHNQNKKSQRNQWAKP